jgi:hypothetical protein
MRKRDEKAESKLSVEEQMQANREKINQRDKEKKFDLSMLAKYA